MKKLETNKETLINQGVKNLSNKIADTRNHYTHLPDSKPPIPINELMVLTKKLKIIIEICFLYELGFNVNTINEISDNFHY